MTANSEVDAAKEERVGAVIQRLRGPLYLQICAISDAYLKAKLPAHFVGPQNAELVYSPTATWVAQIFIRAAQDFLCPDDAARTHARRAEVLREAYGILKEDADFVRLARPREAVHVDGGAEQALKAIELIADRHEAYARSYAPNRKNLTYFYRLGWNLRLTHIGAQDELPLPSAGQAYAVFKLLIGVLQEIAPQKLPERVDYDPNLRAKDILEPMEDGYKAALR